MKKIIFIIALIASMASTKAQIENNDSIYVEQYKKIISKTKDKISVWENTLQASDSGLTKEQQSLILKRFLEFAEINAGLLESYEEEVSFSKETIKEYNALVKKINDIIQKYNALANEKNKLMDENKALIEENNRLKETINKTNSPREIKTLPVFSGEKTPSLY